MGYAQAGFEVEGIDVVAQPHYPFCFHERNALACSAQFLRSFDVVHASPPCQAHSDLKTRTTTHYPDLISLTRQMLVQAGVPYVIENVDTAPLIDPILLCGTMFKELRVIRHRLFESNLPTYTPNVHPAHPLMFTHDKRKSQYGRLDQWTSYIQVTGGGAIIENKLQAMGIDWKMTHPEVNEAVPPPYTRWLGSQILEFLEAF